MSTQVSNTVELTMGEKVFNNFVKEYNLSQDTKEELWDAIQEDYEDGDLNELTFKDIMEIADASGIEFEEDEEEDDEWDEEDEE